MKSSVLDELRYGQPFRDMSEADLAWLEGRIVQRSFAAGESIIGIGDPASRLLFIYRGNVRLEVDPDSRIVAELVPGECFPLETLIPGSIVPSRFRAGQNTTCGELSADDLQALIERSEVFREFCSKRADAMRSHEKRRSVASFQHAENLEDELSRPLSAVVYDPALTMRGDATLGSVLTEMHQQDGRTCLVVNAFNEMIGSFGLRDLLERAVRQPIDTGLRVSSFMAAPFPALPLDAPAYAAVALMAERGCSEVALLHDGKVVGVINEQGLFEAASLNIAALSRHLRAASTLEQWVHVSTLIALYTRQLIEHGLAATRVTRLVSELSDRLTMQIINSEFSKLKLPDGTRWAWLVFGSEGRHEQTLLTDQDNGLVFSLPAGADLEATRRIFLDAAKRINDALAACGYSLCSGGIMAGNPPCCLSVDEWRQKFRNWIAYPEPEAILNATIFFDFRFLTGDASLSTALHKTLAALAPESRRFHLLLAGSALQRTPPIGFFRDFRTDADGMIDLKLGAVAIFVDAARLYSLVHGFMECATDRRFDRLSALGKLEEAGVVAWKKAFAFVQTLRLRMQAEALAAEQPTSNRINPYALNELDRRFLLESLRQAAKLQKRMQLDFSMQ